MKINLYFLSTALILFSACGGPQIKFNETKYGENKPNSKKILLAYASKAGSTAEIADFIGKSFADKGAVVDVIPVKNIRDVTGYQSVVIGSAVRIGSLLPEAVAFAKLHKKELQKIPVAYFVVCGILKENTDENRKIANTYLAPLSIEVTPVDKGLFAGKIDRSKLGFITKMMINSPDGDYRDWDGIKKWADNLFPKLVKQEQL